MGSESAIATQAKWMTWTGWVLSALIAALLTFSGVMKVLQPEGTAEGFAHLGWPISLAIALAVVELGSTLLYLIPGTAGLGAILLTGYLGGAIATHVRIGEGFIVQLILGVVVWVALLLRDPRLRALIPFRR